MTDPKKITEVLNLFPEVTWDRYTADEKNIDIFGWIDRDDALRDFMVVFFRNGQSKWYMTSSAKYSSEFCQRLDNYLQEPSDPAGHTKCQRVKDLGLPVKTIRLGGR